ncbi:hypothetical protein C8F04DRAFT_970877 [Mycena alexandri]|uniref:Uncharacterized protein n=1 Tax=Mycena alexandri TaxID=1745969 RepID=A0AAD6WS15_9AGAR|nr:hypothetical protein C8F04DRAFT_970877 [Mycena alexandri]
MADIKFPPKPLGRAGIHRIISNHCRTMRPGSFVESGCAVCGCLVKRTMLTPITSFHGSLALLIRPGVTRKERFSDNDPASAS